MSRLDWIDDWIERARNADYNANALAKLCSVSPSHLRRYFNAVYFRPPQEWLDELRLWHTVRLLEEGHPVKHVASTLKFGSASHLCHRFKKYHGCTPTAYLLILKRRKARGQLNQGSIQLWKDAEARLLIRVRRGGVSICVSLISSALNFVVM